MKLGGWCIVQKYRPSSNLGVIAPWVRTAGAKNVALGYNVWKISAGCLVIFSILIMAYVKRPNCNRHLEIVLGDEWFAMTWMANPVAYFGEQFWSKRDWCRVVGLFLRRTSSDGDLLRVKDARKVLWFEQHVIACVWYTCKRASIEYNKRRTKFNSERWHFDM